MAIPIIGQRVDEGTVEIARSFSYKLNLQNHGGLAYESADFFASRKMQCAAESATWVSQQLFEECVSEVRESVTRFIEEMNRKMARKTEPQRRTA